MSEVFYLNAVFIASLWINFQFLLSFQQFLQYSFPHPTLMDFFIGLLQMSQRYIRLIEGYFGQE